MALEQIEGRLRSGAHTAYNPAAPVGAPFRLRSSGGLPLDRHEVRLGKARYLEDASDPLVDTPQGQPATLLLEPNGHMSERRNSLRINERTRAHVDHHVPVGVECLLERLPHPFGGREVQLTEDRDVSAPIRRGHVDREVGEWSGIS